jgi:hypothetical protein
MFLLDVLLQLFFHMGVHFVHYMKCLVQKWPSSPDLFSKLPYAYCDCNSDSYTFFQNHTSHMIYTYEIAFSTVQWRYSLMPDNHNWTLTLLHFMWEWIISVVFIRTKRLSGSKFVFVLGWQCSAKSRLLLANSWEVNYAVKCIGNTT